MFLPVLAPLTDVGLSPQLYWVRAELDAECHCWQIISRDTGLTLRMFEVTLATLEVTVLSHGTKAKRPSVDPQMDQSRESSVTQLGQLAAWTGKGQEAEGPVLVVEGITTQMSVFRALSLVNGILNTTWRAREVVSKAVVGLHSKILSQINKTIAMYDGSHW